MCVVLSIIAGNDEYEHLDGENEGAVLVLPKQTEPGGDLFDQQTKDAMQRKWMKKNCELVGEFLHKIGWRKTGTGWAQDNGTGSRQSALKPGIRNWPHDKFLSKGPLRRPFIVFDSECNAPPRPP